MRRRPARAGARRRQCVQAGRENRAGQGHCPRSAMTAPVAPAASYRLAVALVIVTIVVIAKGAMVTSTGSGMAYTTWPLSAGEVMPESSLTTLPGFLEHFHRIAGALAGLLALALTVLALPRAGARAALGEGVRPARGPLVALGWLRGVRP